MKRRFFFAAACAMALAACSGTMPSVTAHKAEIEKPTVRLTLLPQRTLAPGKTVTVLAKLTSLADMSLLTGDDLLNVHTQKIHLLAVDPTLTDYQHIHPQTTSIPGVYSFRFTPKAGVDYRVWADVTPKATGKQTFAMASLGNPRHAAINKTASYESTVGRYHFALNFNTPPKAGDESMGTIHVTDSAGAPVNSLQPVMGAFAHIVGFYDDLRTVVHIHPMGDEPQSDSQRGGPDLTFHLAPEQPGFIKLFAQVKIQGQELYVPFAFTIAP